MVSAVGNLVTKGSTQAIAIESFERMTRAVATERQAGKGDGRLFASAADLVRLADEQLDAGTLPYVDSVLIEIVRDELEEALNGRGPQTPAGC